MIIRFSILIIIISITHAYRILGVFPFCAKSHNIVFIALMKSLAKHGHHVDVISNYPQKIAIENYYDILNLSDPMQSYVDTIYVEDLFKKPHGVTILADAFGNRLCHLMGDESMQKIIRNPATDPSYDLVITEALFANCYMGLGYVFKVPVVAISSGVEFPWITYFTGNTGNLAYVPNIIYSDTGHMNLYGRIKNVLTYYVAIWKFHRATDKSQTDSMRKYLSPNIPNIREVERSVALTLVNSHPILFGIKSITPALLQIGGLHIEANDETLPQELKCWLDKSTAGVVYFSLGSVILIESFSQNKLTNIYASFKKFSPIKILMKVSNRSRLLPVLPENVKTLPWIPQQSVLAHRSVKAFITHGGLGGLQEAVYYGVPLIAMPITGDQFRNVDNLATKKMLVQINFDELSEKVLDAALNAVLYNPIYKESAMRYSKLFRDQPMNATSKAIFWIEYVIRNGADVIRSPALKLSMFQLAILDVYGIFLIAMLFILLIVIFCIKIVARALFKCLPIRRFIRTTKYKNYSYKIM